MSLGEQTHSASSGKPAVSNPVVVCVCDVHHRYGEHVALAGVDLEVHRGQVQTLLGPNGSGKTTLFRLLCTLMPIQRGTIHVAGIDVRQNPLAVRGRIGIVFQSPSLDKKLTVDENIACQAALYGLSGASFRSSRDHWLERLGLIDRRSDFCEQLSGGLKRRVELVKGMLHRPDLLLLDEPSTGLDPAARLDLWEAVRSLADEGTAVLMTTHLLEEADKADQVTILAEGKKIAEGTPSGLRAELGEGIIRIAAKQGSQLEQRIRDELGLEPQRIRNELRLQSDSSAALIGTLVERYASDADSISIGNPSLEDVFIARTGLSFHQAASESS